MKKQAAINIKAQFMRIVVLSVVAVVLVSINLAEPHSENIWQLLGCIGLATIIAGIAAKALGLWRSQ